MDKWKADIHSLSTSDLMLCKMYLEQRLDALPETRTRGERMLLSERLHYVRRELEMRSEQLPLF